MNDKKIINIISTIYFIIVSFLIFIFLTLSVTFIVLQNGLYIDNISTPNLKIKQLYIKWNEKLNSSLKESRGALDGYSPNSTFQYDEIK